MKSFRRMYELTNDPVLAKVLGNLARFFVVNFNLLLLVLRAVLFEQQQQPKKAMHTSPFGSCRPQIDL